VTRFLRLNEVCSLITDGTHYTPQDVGLGVPFLTVKDIDSRGMLDFENCSKITSDEYERAALGNSAPKLGDVLFSKDGTVGKVSVVRDATKFAVLSSIAILRPDTGLVDSDYLGHALRSPNSVDQALKKKTGSAIRRIILSDLKSIQIPVPSLPEQRRIAAILDKADALRVKRHEAIAKLDQLLQSVFLEMFGDPVTNQKGYPLGTLGEFITVGPTNGVSKPKDYFGHGVPILDNKSVYRGMYVDFSEQRLLQVTENELQKLLVVPGDIIFNRVSVKPEGVGVAALALNPPENCIFESNLIRIRLSSDLDPIFAITMLRTEASRSHVLKRANVANQASISQGTISSIPVLVPSVEKQREFSTFVNCLDLQRKRLLVGSQKTQKMFSSLQQRAFEGNL
jgi:type I restriction enzyme S subunit